MNKPNPYNKCKKEELVRLHVLYKKQYEKMEAKLDTLVWDDYLNYMTYVAHFESEFIAKVKERLDKTKRRWYLT